VNVQTEVRIGSEFVGYRIDELIGRGGMGVVYRAYDLRLNRTVALKLMAPELALDQRFRERFSREAELAMSLEHPNVVPIHDAGDVGGRLYLAMRLVEGRDLRALLHAEGAIDPARALAICDQVANALDAAHARGLVHRDVKPSNALLDAREHVYLADFGLTRRLDEEGGPAGEGRSVGTPACLAPEQIEGGSVDGRADVYSLGCLLYECLTGEAPFARGSRLAVAWAHLEEEPPSASARRPELPEAIDAVIRKAMAKQPESRHTSCAALITAAEGALELRRPPPLLRRKTLLLVAAIVVAAFAAAAAIGAVLATGGEPKAAAPLFAGVDTVARIDPATSAVSDVIDVGQTPEAIAAGGRSIWVYNRGEATVSQIDADTRKVRHTTALSSDATDGSVYAGPMLAADEDGAWFVGAAFSGRRRFVLTRIVSGGGKREYRLDQEPRGVAAGFGAVWVVVRGKQGSQLLRIDPSIGRVTRRLHFPTSSPIDSIGVGHGAVWVVSSSAGTLYRINPRSVRRSGKIDVGEGAGRPAVVEGIVVASASGGGQTTFVNPRSLSIDLLDSNCCPPDQGELATLHGWLWSYDAPTGSVYRQHGASVAPREIPVVSSKPVAGGPCLTSIAVSRDAVWVTVALPTGFSCKR
jgi:serine/threonine-protein kinase